jgi:membrane protein CcdC involved in cytochrome C biogenesis
MSLQRHDKPEAALQLDIIVPVVMSCALLWWVSRGMSWTTQLVVTAITLAVIIGILLFERSNF